MSGFLDAFMWYGAIIAMAVLVVSLLIAVVRGLRTQGSNGQTSGTTRSAADPGPGQAGGDNS